MFENAPALPLATRVAIYNYKLFRHTHKSNGRVGYFRKSSSYFPLPSFPTISLLSGAKLYIIFVLSYKQNVAGNNNQTKINCQTFLQFSRLPLFSICYCCQNVGHKIQRFSSNLTCFNAAAAAAGVVPQTDWVGRAARARHSSWASWLEQSPCPPGSACPPCSVGHPPAPPD